MKTNLFFIALFMLLRVCSAGAFEITGNTRIVVSKDAVASTLFAARELAEYIFKTSSIKPEIVTGADRAGSQIIIGRMNDVKNLPSAAKKLLAAAKSPDAFAIVCRDDKLYIVGKERVGELYGVYAFLDEKMGVRWFRAATASDPYEYVPQVSVLQFGNFEIVRDPAFRYRVLSHVGATGKTPVNGQTVAVRQGFQINPPWDHKRAFQEQFYLERCSMLSVSCGGHGGFSTPVSEKLFEKHPEYFALQDGKRVRGKQICISNQQVQDLVEKYIENIYKTVNINNITYLFGMLDTTTGWCECKECRKLDGSGKTDDINVSSRFHKVVTKIADKIYKKYPDANLESWAYHTYRTIPENVKYDPRTLIYYCTHGRCYGHELQDPDCFRNVRQLDLIKQWRKIAKRMKVYEYASCTPVLYGCMEDILCKDLRLYRKLGLEGWKEEIRFADARFWPPVKKGEVDHRADRANSNWQWYCVAGKLLWNPDLDPEAILADVESKYYGKSYPAMKKYHDFRRKLWNNSPYCFGYPTGDQRRERLLSVYGAGEKLLALLAEAEKLAGDDPILRGRLKDDRNWLTRYWIQPNEELRKQPDKSSFIPIRSGEIRIDGDPSDAGWLRAWFTSDFQYSGNKNKAARSGNTPRTVLAVLADKQNLYCRIEAGASGSHGDPSQESIVFFIMPPTAVDRHCYVKINSVGKVIETNLPGGRSRIAAAAKTSHAGYVVEVKIPLDRLGIAGRGSLWKLQAARYLADNSCLNMNAGGFRSMVIGSPFLKNGSFENLNDKALPENWNSKNCEIIKTRSSNAVKLVPGSHIYQFMTHPELNQQPVARKIKVTFQASGRGSVNVYAVRYNDTRDGKAKHGYRRKFLSTQLFYQAALQENRKVYSCEYTINPDEWIALRFIVSGSKASCLCLDDVAVSMMDK